MGVDLFFILSGFIISYVHQKDFKDSASEGTSRFLILRLARLLPVHYAVLTIMALFQLTKALTAHNMNVFWETGSFEALIYHLLNIQAWVPSDNHDWNTPAWSISADWFAYICFPFIAYFLPRIKSIVGNVLVIVLCMLALHGVKCAFFMVGLHWNQGLGLYRVLTEFISGCALYNIYRQTGDKHFSWIEPLSVITLLTLVWLNAYDVLIVAVMPLLLLSLAKGKGALSSLLSFSPMLFLGEISYSLYLVHDFIFCLIKPYIEKFHLISGNQVMNCFVLLGFIMISIISATLLYRYIEVPFRDIIRNLKPLQPFMAVKNKPAN
jgi:peptidoglycan/LPS O-acetylase OafA/YrhL